MTTETAKPRVHEFESSSAAETIRVGHEIAKLLKPPTLLILRGDLGAGKTTLVKGIAEALDAADPDEVTSPTFTLIHEYEGTQTVDGHKTPVNLYHLDLYRIEGERQLDTLGLDELATPDSILLVEWGEKFPSVVKRSQGEIVMVSTGGDARKITLTFKE
jgi:tRNA threonylcarbamoyladenosine biosynthesis protein TsaE